MLEPHEAYFMMILRAYYVSYGHMCLVEGLQVEVMPWFPVAMVVSRAKSHKDRIRLASMEEALHLSPCILRTLNATAAWESRWMDDPETCTISRHCSSRVG